MIIVRTPVRVSFGGGGTDLPSFYLEHGGEVLSTSINKYFYTVITGRDDRMVQLISSDFRVLEYYDQLDRAQPEKAELGIPLAAIKHLSPQVGMNLFLASEIPPGTGLGSSACVCVNILRAVSAFVKRNLTKHELAEMAFHVAADRLARPVGKQDEYASAFGGLNHIQFGEHGVDLAPVKVDEDIVRGLEERLLLFFMGSSRQSTEILSEQDHAIRHGDAKVIEALQGVRSLVPLMKEALLGGELDEFGALLHQAWAHKKRFSEQVSNPFIDQVYELARRNGALGGKVTGAGGGGFLLLYVPPDSQEAVKQALASKDLKEMQFGFDLHGARIVYDDPFFDSGRRGELLWKFVRLD